MRSKSGSLLLTLGAMSFTVLAGPIAAPAEAKGWDRDRPCWSGGDRRHCGPDRDRWERERRERERRRRKDAKADGVVAGVVGAAVVGGIIAAAASSNKKNKEKRERRGYCIERYGNYDERTDSYRAADGAWYKCE